MQQLGYELLLARLERSPLCAMTCLCGSVCCAPLSALQVTHVRPDVLGGRPTTQVRLVLKELLYFLPCHATPHAVLPHPLLPRAATPRAALPCVVLPYPAPLHAAPPCSITNFNPGLPGSNPSGSKPLLAAPFCRSTLLYPALSTHRYHALSLPPCGTALRAISHSTTLPRLLCDP